PAATSWSSYGPRPSCPGRPGRGPTARPSPTNRSDPPRPPGLDGLGLFLSHLHHELSAVSGVAADSAVPQILGRSPPTSLSVLPWLTGWQSNLDVPPAGRQRRTCRCPEPPRRTTRAGT